MVSGYLGGKADQVMMTINDTLIALPNFPILLLVYFVMRDQMSWPSWRSPRRCSAGTMMRASSAR